MLPLYLPCTFPVPSLYFPFLTAAGTLLPRDADGGGDLDFKEMQKVLRAPPAPSLKGAASAVAALNKMKK